MGRAKNEKETCLMNMYGVMFADGKATQDESNVFLVVSTKFFGFTMEETMAIIDKVRKNPESIKYAVPKDESERIDHLAYSVLMMMSDGHMHAKELELCRKYAAALGLSSAVVSDLIKGVKKSKGRD